MSTEPKGWSAQMDGKLAAIRKDPAEYVAKAREAARRAERQRLASAQSASTATRRTPNGR